MPRTHVCVKLRAHKNVHPPTHPRENGNKVTRAVFFFFFLLFVFVFLFKRGICRAYTHGSKSFYNFQLKSALMLLGIMLNFNFKLPSNRLLTPLAHPFTL